jgi:hypothetical protein
MGKFGLIEFACFGMENSLDRETGKNADPGEK